MPVMAIAVTPRRPTTTPTAMLAAVPASATFATSPARTPAKRSRSSRPALACWPGCGWDGWSRQARLSGELPPRRHGDWLRSRARALVRSRDTRNESERDHRGRDHGEEDPGPAEDLAPGHASCREEAPVLGREDLYPHRYRHIFMRPRSWSRWLSHDATIRRAEKGSYRSLKRAPKRRRPRA